MENIRLKKIINKFCSSRILVVGDLLLDEFIWGSVERISPEAPVPIVWAKRRQFLPGGAANVADNIHSLGADVTICGIRGADQNGTLLSNLLKKKSIKQNAVFVERKRPTITKTRIVAQHQQVVRVDWEDVSPLDEKLIYKIISYIEKNINKFDAVIIEDYGKGVVNRTMLQHLIPLVKKHNKIVTVDPKEDHFDLYSGATAITPNLKEAENAIYNLKIKDQANSLKINTHKIAYEELDNIGTELLKYLDLQALLVTLGDKGMRLFQKDKKPLHIDTVAQEVFDVTGAGDTVIAAFTLCLTAGASFLDAAYISNFAAGIVVGKVGTATVTRKELIHRMKL